MAELHPLSVHGDGHTPTVSRTRTLRVGLYARVSTSDQEPENQLAALRAFAEARGWRVTEFVDHGVSGAKERRAALDALLAAARARRMWIRTRTRDPLALLAARRIARSP